ncbi:SDR family oxidoreductase [Acerihabitans arboris]|uniref:SDR family oxidoreductase n=1 Tax=Acerihabitans arboris TaxID=2691583 RepID=A0A845SI86_9GAMM|nr:SDR family oxidoreductase [Acerihabitans arboris]NDL62674.1 SDR family oxidoreductase [Acerihabitans arboris]
MSQALQGKIALVTGGSTGIGLGIARQFVNEGAFVFITARRQAQLDNALAELGSQAVGIQADVADLGELDKLFAGIREHKGHLDIVVANAGGGELLGLAAITEEHYDRTFDTNVKGVLFTVQKALPLLAKGASVILTGSTTSVTGGKNFSVYSATKAAVRNFARSWILDLEGQDIRVNVLSPGPVKTPGLLGLTSPDQQQALLDGLAALVPLGRVGDPDEIGKVAVFLASDAASFVNGAELFVDGGQAQI